MGLIFRKPAVLLLEDGSVYKGNSLGKIGSATGENGTGGGSNGAVADKATTTDGNGSGLVVDLTIANNVCSAIAVDAAAGSDGNGYRIGDKITVAKADSGTTTDVVGYVTSLEYED